MQTTEQIYIKEAGILRNNLEFASGENYEIYYDFENEEYPQLIEEYGIDKIKGAMRESCTPVQPDDKLDRLEELKEKYTADYLYIMKNMTYMQYCDYYTVGESDTI